MTQTRGQRLEDGVEIVSLKPCSLTIVEGTVHGERIRTLAALHLFFLARFVSFSFLFFSLGNMECFT
jgi:hypothetical protein